VPDTNPSRLRAARAAAGWSSAGEASAAYGWKESTFRHHENGTRRFGPAAAARYAEAFRVSVDWLLDD